MRLISYLRQIHSGKNNPIFWKYVKNKGNIEFNNFLIFLVLAAGIVKLL